MFRTSLVEELGEKSGDYCIFRNFHTPLYYIRKRDELSQQGMFISLRGYQFQVFTEFTWVHANKELDELYQEIGGNGMDREKIVQWLTQDQ